MTAAEQSHGAYLDTTIVDRTNPGALVRVDTTPHTTGSASAHATEIEAALTGQPGYARIAWLATTITGYPGWYWELTVTEGGVPLHKVDIFFNDAGNNGFAILTKAPEDQWPSYEPLFAGLRDTLIAY